GRALLLEVARPRARGGEEPAHLRLRQRDGEPDSARAPARARPGARHLEIAGPGKPEGGCMTALAQRSLSAPGLDVEKVRKDFPILGQEVRGKPLVYLDSAATSQKPRAVIDAVARYYLQDDANVHRGVRLLALAHVSNTLGTINPVRRIVEIAHRHGIPVLLDGAQAAPHFPIDVRALDCDFYAFSGHKLFGPTGIGVLYGRSELLEEMPPWQGGGDMISSVTFEKTTWNKLPHKFEAGTPDIAGAIGLGAAIDYVGALGFAAIAA